MEAVLVFGSGRWALNYLKDISRLIGQRFALIIISSSPVHEIKARLRAFEISNHSIEIHKTTDNLTHVSFVCAFIVNKAHSHASALQWCLTKRIPTLVEKPLVVSEQYDDLIKLIESRSFVGGVSCLQYFSSYRDRLFNLQKTSIREMKSIEISWWDNSECDRWGGKVTFDQSIPIIEDIMNHVLWLVYPVIELRMECIGLRVYSDELLEIYGAEIPIFISAQRAPGLTRARVVKFSFINQSELEIDLDEDLEVETSSIPNESGPVIGSSRPLFRMIEDFCSHNISDLDGRNNSSSIWPQSVKLALAGCRLCKTL